MYSDSSNSEYDEYWMFSTDDEDDTTTDPRNKSTNNIDRHPRSPNHLNFWSNVMQSDSVDKTLTRQQDLPTTTSTIPLATRTIRANIPVSTRTIPVATRPNLKATRSFPVDTRTIPVANRPVTVAIRTIPAAIISSYVATRPAHADSRPAHQAIGPFRAATRLVQAASRPVPAATRPVHVTNRPVVAATRPLSVTTNSIWDTKATEVENTASNCQQHRGVRRTLFPPQPVTVTNNTSHDITQELRTVPVVRRGRKPLTVQHPQLAPVVHENIQNNTQYSLQDIRQHVLKNVPALKTISKTTLSRIVRGRR